MRGSLLSIFIFFPIWGFSQTDTTEFLFEQGLGKYMLGRHEEAVFFFSRVLEREKTNELAFYNRGLCYLGLKNFPEAERDLKKSIRIRKSFSKGYLGLGVLYIEKGNFKKALRFLSRSLHWDHGQYQAYFNRCLAWIELKDFGRAMEEVNKALDIYPDFPEGLIFKGIILYETGFYNDAIATFDESIHSDPGISMAYYNRALAKIKLDYIQAACADLGKARELGYTEAEKVMQINCKANE